MPGLNGEALGGFFIVPKIGAYKAQIIWKSILDALRPPVAAVPGVMKRSEEEQYLRPWDERDFTRLGLRPAKQAQEKTVHTEGKKHSSGTTAPEENLWETIRQIRSGQR
jgi:hypothetical protein